MHSQNRTVVSCSHISSLADVGNGGSATDSMSRLTSDVATHDGLVEDLLHRVILGTGTPCNSELNSSGAHRHLATSSMTPDEKKIAKLAKQIKRNLKAANANLKVAQNLAKDLSWIKDIVLRTSVALDGIDFSVSVAFDSIATNLQQLEVDVQQVSGDVQTLQQTVSTSSISLSSITNDIVDHSSTISSLEQSINSVDNSVTNLLSSMSSLSNAVVGKDASIAKLTSDASANTAATTTLMASVTSTLASANAQASAVKSSTDKLQCVNGSRSDANNIYFDGCNVHVRNGAGATSTINGLGNLIIGSNENGCSGGPCSRTGSHNLVLGKFHSYTSYSGIVAGTENVVSKPFATVTAGNKNQATGNFASVTGGSQNKASGEGASIAGGRINEASGFASSVAGGYLNVALAEYSAVKGGKANVASVSKSVVP